MRASIRHFAAVLVLGVSSLDCPGAPESGELRVLNDGLVSMRPLHGETTWSGTITIEHPRFRMEVQGRASLFAGPSIRRKGGPGPILDARELEAEEQWISLVAIGEITIRVRGAAGESPPVHAGRVVYLPAQDRIMIDGELWVEACDPGSVRSLAGRPAAAPCADEPSPPSGPHSQRPRIPDNSDVVKRLYSIQGQPKRWFRARRE